MDGVTSIEQDEIIAMYDFVVIAVAENVFNVFGMVASEFGSVYGIVIHQAACKLCAVFGEA